MLLTVLQFSTVTINGFSVLSPLPTPKKCSISTTEDQETRIHPPSPAQENKNWFAQSRFTLSLPPHPTPPPTCPRKTQKTEVFTVQIPPNPDTPPPPPHPKKFGDPALTNFQVPFGTNFHKLLGGGGHRLQPRFFTELSPRNFGQQKMPAWKPSIFPLGLGWPGPKFPEFIGRPGQRKTIVKTGGLQPRFSPKRSTPNLGENKTFSFFPHQRSLGRALRKNLGWKPPYSLWFPLAWGFSQSSPQGILDNKKIAGLKTLCLPSGFLRPGVAGPKIPKIYWEARPKENHSENGGSSAQIFPKALHTESWREQNILLFFPTKGLWGELWGKIWVENPHFPYGFLWLGWSGAKNSQAGQR